MQQSKRTAIDVLSLALLLAGYGSNVAFVGTNFQSMHDLAQRRD